MPELTDSGSPSNRLAATASGRRTRRVLLGGGLATMATGMTVGLTAQRADAAAGTDAWLLGGNSGVNTDGSNFLGTTNVAPLVFKTAATRGAAAERMRIAPSGRVGVGVAAPAAQLDVAASSGTTLRAQAAGTAGNDIAISGVTSNGNAVRATATGTGTAVRAVAGAGKAVHATATSGTGILGTANNGAGVVGQHLNATGTNAGVLGTTASSDDYAPGVRGINTGNGALGAGVYGSHAGSGRGVYGEATDGSGVYGSSGTGAGLAGDGGPYGAQATAHNPDGIGLQATAPNSFGSNPNAVGVQGIGTVGVQGTGEYLGVQGSAGGYAVFGTANPDTGGTGVYGRGYLGVAGRSYHGSAVYGETDDGIGVRGESNTDGDSVAGIVGRGFGAANTGVLGQADNGATAYGIWGVSSTGYAGYFNGNVTVVGTLVKAGGSFQIDHPQDPTNKYLSHSFVESPDMMNVYNGNVTTGADGTATVALPDYFESLNSDYRYQLTVLGDFAQAVVRSKISDGRFVIATDKPRVEVSWQVTGIRQDPWAEANRIPVAVDKPQEARGTYLHPEVYGKRASAQEQAGRIAAISKPAAAQQPDPKPPVATGRG